MKIHRTLSIDQEIWYEAKKKTDNLSGTIEKLLKEWSKTAIDENKNSEISKLKAELAKNAAEKAALQDKIIKQEEAEKKRKSRVIWEAPKEDPYMPPNLK